MQLSTWLGPHASMVFGFRARCRVSADGGADRRQGLWFTRSQLGQDDDRLAYRVNLAYDMSAPAMLGRVDGGDLSPVSARVSFDQSAAAAAVRPSRGVANGAGRGDQWRRARHGERCADLDVGRVRAEDGTHRSRGDPGWNRSQAGHSRAARHISRLFGPRPAGESALSPQITSPRVRTEVKPDYSRGSDEESQRGYGDDGRSGAAGRIGRAPSGSSSLWTWTSTRPLWRRYAGGGFIPGSKTAKRCPCRSLSKCRFH